MGYSDEEKLAGGKTNLVAKGIVACGRSLARLTRVLSLPGLEASSTARTWGHTPHTWEGEGSFL